MHHLPITQVIRLATHLPIPLTFASFPTIPTTLNTLPPLNPDIHPRYPYKPHPHRHQQNPPLFHLSLTRLELNTPLSGYEPVLRVRVDGVDECEGGGGGRGPGAGV